ncbi:hypothetical protein ACFWEU_13175, partial [Streptomyces albidoflavus]
MTTTCLTRSLVGASAKKRGTRLYGSAGLPREIDERSQDLTGEPAGAITSLLNTFTRSSSAQNIDLMPLVFFRCRFVPL